MDVSSRGAATLLGTAAAPVLWGTTYIVMTGWLPERSALAISTLRVLTAGVVLVVWRRARSVWRPTHADRRAILVVGAANFAVFFPLVTVAVQRLPGGVAAAVGGIQPLAVCGLTAGLTRSRPRRRDVVLGSLAAVGVALIVIQPRASVDVVGVLAALGANVSFAVGTVATKRLPRPTDPIAATGYQMLAAATVLVPITLTVDGMPTRPTWNEAAAMGYLGLIATAVAFVMWFAGIRRLASSAPPLLGLLAPATGTIIGWIALEQAMTWIQLVGFAITGVAIAAGALAGTSPASHERDLGALRRSRPTVSANQS
jgi:probable blue pigment (indigoidine) exporter